MVCLQPFSHIKYDRQTQKC